MQMLELCFIEVVSQFCEEKKTSFHDVMKRISHDNEAMLYFLNEAEKARKYILGEDKK